MTRARESRLRLSSWKKGTLLLVATWAATGAGEGLERAEAAKPVTRTLEARIFPLHEAKTPLFRFRSEESLRIEARGSDVRRTYRLVSRFTDASGEDALVETYEALSSASPAVEERETYLYEQKQTGETGRVERVGKKVSYRFRGADGKEREATELASEDWAPGPALHRRLRMNWTSILEGRPLPVRIAVPERLESFAFEFRPDESTLPAGRDARGVRIWLEPRVFWIRLLVRPIEVWMSPDGSGPREIRGRTLLKWKTGDSLEDFSGFISFLTLAKQGAAQ